MQTSAPPPSNGCYWQVGATARIVWHPPARPSASELVPRNELLNLLAGSLVLVPVVIHCPVDAGAAGASSFVLRRLPQA